MWATLFSILLAFAIAYWSIPPIINLSLIKRLYDEPDQRKLHDRRTGALGGIAIFGSFLFTFILFTKGLPYPQQNSILAAYLILFVIGVKDDLFPLTPRKKFLGQVLAVAIVVLQGDVRIQSFYGLFNIHDLPYAVSVGLSIMAFLLLINSFNFIDGINGLSAGLGLVVFGTFAYWFWRMEQGLFLLLCTSYAGALLGFLPFNYRKKAKIFMGDSGSMILGFNIALITIFFIQESVVHRPNIFFAISSAVYAYAVIIIPIFDTLRVVLIRLFKGRSPFHADRNHIHHVLLDIGLSHRQATAVLVATALLFVGVAGLMKDVVVPKFQLLILTALAAILSQIPFLIKRSLKNGHGK